MTSSKCQTRNSNLKALDSSSLNTIITTMAVPWRSTLPLILLSSVLFFDEWLSSPICRLTQTTTPNENGREMGGEAANELKVMMVADLLLLGSESTLFDSYFRDYYMAKFFRVNSCNSLHFHHSEF